MIVPMKKVSILVQSKDSAEAIGKLRALGLVHVEHQRLPRGENLNLLKEDIALTETVRAILAQDELSPARHLPQTKELTDWKFTAKHILDLRNRLNQLKDYALTLNNRISQWHSWGDFDPEAIRGLAQQNIYLRLYQIPVKQLNKVTPQVIVQTISVSGGIANCAVLSRERQDLPFRPVALPKVGLSQLRARLVEDQNTMQSIRDEMGQATSYRQAFLRTQHSLEEKLEFHQALSGMGAAEGLAYLTGYIPFDAVKPLEQAAGQQKWGMMINDPAETDRVPTLIRNPRWVSIIKPVFKLIEVIPGYKELDISLWFLVFFSIFFGMLIGDAGIGLIFIALTFLAQRKWGRKLADKSLFVLLYISSACAVLWGVLSGTLFGQEWLPQWVRPLMPALRDDKTVQNICFFIGAVHLSIAHAWRGLIKLPSLSALAEAGWIAILSGAFFLARMLVLGFPLPAFAKWLFVAGGVSVVLFTQPSRNLLKGVGAGLGNLLLNLVNSFTDVVSYVRLFAVGLATVAVADSFNKMAMEIGFNSLGAGLTTALILLVGHSLNVVLAPMSILVHGVRLNVLEFCNHIDIKWSGFAYKPLRKERGE